MKKIVLTGGGTGGHVTPNLALIPRLQADGWEISYIGSENGVERELITAVPGIKYYGISVGKLRRYHDLKNLSDPFRVIKGLAQATHIIRKIKPDVLFSKGGFVSVPAVYGAALNHVPIVTHESDLTPGLANKLCLRYSMAQCCAFPEAVRYAGDKGVYTGSPIRTELMKGSRAAGLKRFGLKEDKKVLLVMGGSSGAQAINEAVRAALPKLLGSFQVLHLCGKGNLDPKLENTEGYVQCDYLTDGMADAYACAEIMVSRAGANSLFEILALKKPVLLIPYPKGAGRGDQEENAASFLKRGLCKVLEQADLTPDTLWDKVVELYHDRGTIRDAMAQEPCLDGTDAVLEQIYKFAKK